jgi:hypothetical protein
MQIGGVGQGGHYIAKCRSPRPAMRTKAKREGKYNGRARLPFAARRPCSEGRLRLSGALAGGLPRGLRAPTCHRNFALGGLQKHGSASVYGEARTARLLKRSHHHGPTDARVHTAWRPTWPAARRRLRGHGLKHTCEKWCGRSVTNGKFIAAAINSGSKWKQSRSEPNVVFNISERSLVLSRGG